MVRKGVLGIGLLVIIFYLLIMFYSGICESHVLDASRYYTSGDIQGGFHYSEVARSDASIIRLLALIGLILTAVLIAISAKK